jgi:tetratricopeptide (TPR) repeat protein
MGDKRIWQDLRNQAWDAKRRGDFQQAVSLLTAAVQEVSTLPEDRADLSMTLNTLANLYAETGQVTNAIEIATRDIEVCRQLPGEARILLGSSLMFLAHVLLEARRYAEAIDPATEGAKIYSTVMGEAHSETVRMRQVLAEIQAGSARPS